MSLCQCSTVSTSEQRWSRQITAWQGGMSRGAPGARPSIYSCVCVASYRELLV